MKDKIALAIVALMITSLAYALSTTSVSATHEPPTASITVDELTVVKADTSKTYKLTVINTGGHAIDNVTVFPHDSFTGIALVWTIGKDNLLHDNTNDNVVVLKKDTTVRLYFKNPAEKENAVVPENTIVLVKPGEKLYVFEQGAMRMIENLQGNAQIRLATSENTEENITQADNLVLFQDVRVTMRDNRLKLTTDVDVENKGDNCVKLIENATVRIVVENVLAENATRDNLSVGGNVTLVLAKKVTFLDNLSGSKLAANLTGDVEGVGTCTVPEGRYAALYDDTAWLQAGTKISFPDNENLRVFENTIVTKENGSMLFRATISLGNKTPGWTGDATHKQWTTTTAAKMIAAGNRGDFYFTLTSPATEGEYTFVVTTEDNVGGPNNIQNVEVTVSVDNTRPYVTSITVPEWAKGIENVTITVVMNEVISPKGSWVVVRENNAPENVEVTMTSTDNITWTGTYTTTDNVLRDGLACIWVIGENYLDRVKLIGMDNTDNFKCDRRAPPRPTADAPYHLTSLPSKTNQGSWKISGKAVDTRYDNNLPDNLRENIKGMKVVIRTRDVTFEAWSDVTGAFSKVISLSEGKNEVGVKFIDLAGNEGLENVQTVFYDATKPVITPVSIAGIPYEENMHIKDNKPTIVLTIADPGYDENTEIATGCGVDNLNYVAATHSGFRVELWSVVDTTENHIENLTNAKPWSKVTGEFENSRTTALSDGWYKIKVYAGDNLQSTDVKILRFKIDTVKPGKPSFTVTAYETTTELAPKVLRTLTATLAGRADPYATVNIYTYTSPFTEAEKVLAKSVEADKDGEWSATITIEAGVVTKVMVSQVNLAGNEGEKRLYGYLMTDATSPTISDVTVDGVLYTAKVIIEKRSVIVAGKVSDDVSTWDKITLTISYAVTSMDLPLTQVTEKVGSFSKNISIPEGVATITLVAEDEAGNKSSAVTLEIELTVTPMGTYAIIFVIIALVLAAIAIVRKR